MREISTQNIAVCFKRRLLNRGQFKRHHYIILPVNNSKLMTTDFFPSSIINRVLIAQKFLRMELGIDSLLWAIGRLWLYQLFHKSYIYIRYTNHTDLLISLGLDVQLTWAARSTLRNIILCSCLYLIRASVSSTVNGSKNIPNNRK